MVAGVLIFAEADFLCLALGDIQRRASKADMRRFMAVRRC
jgi:hypothetical protein